MDLKKGSWNYTWCQWIIFLKSEEFQLKLQLSKIYLQSVKFLRIFWMTQHWLKLLIKTHWVKLSKINIFRIIISNENGDFLDIGIYSKHQNSYEFQTVYISGFFPYAWIRKVLLHFPYYLCETIMWVCVTGSTVEYICMKNEEFFKMSVNNISLYYEQINFFLIHGNDKIWVYAYFSEKCKVLMNFDNLCSEDLCFRPLKWNTKQQLKLIVRFYIWQWNTKMVIRFGTTDNKTQLWFSDFKIKIWNRCSDPNDFWIQKMTFQFFLIPVTKGS